MAFRVIVASVLWLAATPICIGLVKWLWNGGLERNDDRMRRVLDDERYFMRIAQHSPMTAVFVCALIPAAYCMWAFDGRVDEAAFLLMVVLFCAFGVLWPSLSFFGRPRWLIPPRYRT
jgi:uncharacterized membrane protein